MHQHWGECNSAVVIRRWRATAAHCSDRGSTSLASTDQGFASLSAGDLKSLKAEAIDGDELFDLLAGTRWQ